MTKTDLSIDSIEDILIEVEDVTDVSIFKDIPNHWSLVKIEEICKNQKEGIDPQKFPEEFFEYYSIPAFQEQIGPLRVKGEYILSIKLIVQNHTILFGKLNPRVLKVWLVDSETEDRKIASTEFIPLIPGKRVFPKFVYYLCQSKFVVSPAKKLVSGSTPSRQRVDITSFYKIQVPLPPLPEQRTIAHILQTVQQAIQTRRKELELERERKAALMHHLFTHGTRNEPMKQSEIGEIPENWKTIKLGNICISSAFGPRFSGNYYNDYGNIATLRTTDMDDDGNINYSTMPLAELDIKHFEDHLLQYGDLLITRSGTCGIAAIFESFDKPVLPGAFLIRFRLSSQVIPYFLQYYINSSMGKIRVASLASGAIQKNLTGTALRELSIPLPSLNEQAEIVNILRLCSTKITALEKEITLHEELFRTLLDELMTGRISTLPLIEQLERKGL